VGRGMRHTRTRILERRVAGSIIFTLLGLQCSLALPQVPLTASMVACIRRGASSSPRCCSCRLRGVQRQSHVPQSHANLDEGATCAVYTDWCLCIHEFNAIQVCGRTQNTHRHADLRSTNSVEGTSLLTTSLSLLPPYTCHAH
jgi:hypothetical protein